MLTGARHIARYWSKITNFPRLYCIRRPYLGILHWNFAKTFVVGKTLSHFERGDRVMIGSVVLTQSQHVTDGRRKEVRTQLLQYVDIALCATLTRNMNKAL